MMVGGPPLFLHGPRVFPLLQFRRPLDWQAVSRLLRVNMKAEI
jgi:hypothetical protein